MYGASCLWPAWYPAVASRLGTALPDGSAFRSCSMSSTEACRARLGVVSDSCAIGGGVDDCGIEVSAPMFQPDI
eukprot:6462563-Amphidinium_carterae.2